MHIFTCYYNILTISQYQLTCIVTQGFDFYIKTYFPFTYEAEK